MIEQPATLSAGQRIASLRQFFRSRRADAQVSGMGRGAGNGFEPTQWPETEWSDTRFDEPSAQNA
jgi:hypothetical protein